MRYQIWDKKSNIITPIGEVLTPEQWVKRYPMAGVDGIKTIISGGVINGAVLMEFTGTVENFAKRGCDFSACETDQDYLDAIEAFEDNQNAAITTSAAAAAAIPTADERIAAALEAQVMMSLPDEEE